MTHPTAVVTFGGTSEPLDDVRVLTNRSRGRFGAAIVRALLESGVEVVALGSEPALAVLRGGGPLPGSCRLVPFETTADLAARLRDLEATPPALLFMAAAVSDYRPRAQAGKIRSDAETLSLELERTPKLLPTFRERFGAKTFLVGFKLLSGVPTAELIAVAARQVQSNQLDLTVANDLATFTEVDHPVQLVTPDGAAVPVSGARESVARRVAAFALARAGLTPELPAPAPTPAGAVALWEFAQASGALANGGEVSWSDGERGWLSVGDSWRAAQPWIQQVSGVVGVLRLNAVGASQHRVPAGHFPWSQGEAQAVLQALLVSARRGHDAAAGFGVELAEGTVLIGVPEGGLEALRSRWAEAQAACAVVATSGPAQPLWDEGQIVGVALRGPDWVAPFVPPAVRCRGLGDRIADRIAQRGWRVATSNEEEAFYLRRGFRLVGSDGPYRALDPPSFETPARVGASVCLVDPRAGRVLMGVRRVEPWRGRTSFPGGGVEAGEQALEAARRELHEETGLRAPNPPWQERVVYAGTADRVVRVHCFVIPTLTPEEPRLSDEFAGEWLTPAEARTRALTPSAGCILDEVERFLAQ